MLNVVKRFNKVFISQKFLSRGMALETVKVELNEGIVIGAEEKLPNGNPYYTFKGIPYAEPCLGRLRFEDPIPITKFSEKILDCTKERDVSYHKDLVSLDIIGSENCLHLNVYSPISTKDVSNKKPLAVMIWIHGGAFMAGSGNSEYYSPEYLVQENVVVVTLNYRLGALGFLSLPDAGISGNAGIKDQLTAIKWVNKNISKFGGDANNVTLFGESAGGSSVHLHLLSEKSRKYFHKAICQSGTALHEWVIQPNPIEKSKKLAELLSFQGGSEQETLDYLKSVKDLAGFINHIIGVLTTDEKRRGLPMSFKPCIEKDTPNAILSKSPIELMNRPNFTNIPVMMGYNNNEGIINIADAYKRFNMFEKDLAKMIPRSLNVPNDSASETESQMVAKLIRDFYFGGQIISDKLLAEMSQLQTDYHFAISTHLTAEIHSRKQPKSPLYFYRFSYDGDFNLYKKLLRMKCNAIKSLKGACHGDEMFYLFNLKLIEIERSKNSISTRIARDMCKMWTNFAKYGNPTPSDDTTLPVKWNPVKSPQDGEKFVLDFLEIDEKMQMERNPDNDRIEFWKELYQKWNGGFLKHKL